MTRSIKNIRLDKIDNQSSANTVITIYSIRSDDQGLCSVDVSCLLTNERDYSRRETGQLLLLVVVVPVNTLTGHSDKWCRINHISRPFISCRSVHNYIRNSVLYRKLFEEIEYISQ